MPTDNEHRSKAVIVLDVPKDELADGTMALINQRIKEVINTGERLESDTAKHVSLIRWFDAETVSTLTEAEIDAAVAEDWNGNH